MTINNGSFFHYCTSEYGNGGALLVDIADDSSFKVLDATFTNNTAKNSTASI